ncbi:MAG: hypothetical protein SFY81_07945 [Verrucomicrobiota bacterium]|nr:hypothetical protein [Verrucomicrobiota bacterium]
MQITSKFHSKRGSALLVTLVTAVVIGTTLASYLGMVKYQNQSNMRSLYWNTGLPVAEAGVEEALTHLAWADTNLAQYGWTLTNGSFYKERMIGTSKVQVRMSVTNPPTILAQAYILDPKNNAFIEPPRTVRVTTTNDALFAKGMVAKGVIDLNGNNIETDSFDSTDTNYSTNGKYVASKSKDNGDVATNSGLINSLNVGNANIKGKASTGPGGSVSVGSNGSVGSKAWVDGGHNGIQPGWTTDDMNVAFPDVKVPFTGGGFTPASGNVGGTNFQHILAGGNYQMSSLSMSGQQKMLVTGNSVLYITGNASMSGQSQIILAPGATLRMYVAGPTASLGGNGIINNGSALNFSYFGLPSNTSLSFAGNAAFTGTIYAPSAAFTLGGGGNNNYDFVGASVTSTVQMNGHFHFHYDEALGKIGPRRGYTVTSWNEI